MPFKKVADLNLQSGFIHNNPHLPASSRNTFWWQSTQDFFQNASKKSWTDEKASSDPLAKKVGDLFFLLDNLSFLSTWASGKWSVFHVHTRNRCFTDIRSLKVCDCAKDICALNMRKCVCETGLSSWVKFLWKWGGSELKNSQHLATYRSSQPHSPLWWGCTGPCPGPSVNGRPHLPKHSWKTKSTKSEVFTLGVNAFSYIISLFCCIFPGYVEIVGWKKSSEN